MFARVIRRVKRKGGKAPASLARASATLALARTSVGALDRPSPVPGVDDAAIQDIKQAVKDAEGYLDAEDQQRLDDQIDAVQRAANNLERVSAVAMGQKKK